MTEDELREAEQLANSLGGLCETLNVNNVFGDDFSPQISQANGLFDNNRWYLISNLRQLLSQIYVEHGIIQTLCDQPVDDAFRAGFEIKTSQFDADDIEQLMIYCERNRVIDSVIQSIKWGRLYGGGAELIITDQDPKTPLNLTAIGPKTPLEFRSVDMWELYYDEQNTVGTLEPGGALGTNMGEFYDYYGQQVHESRVMRVIGKEPPSFIKPRLRGWGMSAVEPMVRSLNQYLKNQDVIFDLLDEAKVDVYKMKGFNNALVNSGGTTQLAKRIQLANRIKNYNHAIAMDAEDDFIQKQITFTGLSEVLLQIRQGLAADLKMPMTKLFGISAAGFNSGEDDIENYNAMIEGEIRSKNKFMVVDVLLIACQKVFGFMPSDLMITWNPLRILNAKEEEEVKDSQFNRVISAFSAGLAQDKEAKEAINRDSLLGIELDESVAALPPIGGDFEVEKPKIKSATGKEQKENSKKNFIIEYDENGERKKS